MRPRSLTHALLLTVGILASFVSSHAQTSPQITQVAPASGPPGALVTLTGAGFGGSPGSVTLGGATAAISSWTDVRIVIVVPSAAQGTGVSVTSSTGTQSNTAGFTVLPPSTFAGPVSYAYDDLGRLIGVVAATGDAIAYSYDTVGNILSITRYTSTQQVLFDFTPKSGPVGTSVTIHGSNFSSTPSQDTVSFNGTAASVQSASATTLIVTVPQGSTTGLITITSPAGTGSTSTAFTVTTSNGQPHIDSFSPQIVAAGTSVAIAGSNFDPSPTNDRMILNATPGLNPSTATATSMNLAVPAATGSGKIALSTPNGSAISSSDLFIPPTSFSPSSVGYTGRTTSGAPVTVTLSTANQIGLVLLDGEKGQLVSVVNSSGSTFGGCTITIQNPSNTTLPSSHASGQAASGSCTTANSILDSERLPATGTYALVISPGTSTGHATITPYLFSDVVGTITVGGSTVPVTTTVPGQNARLTFHGSPGQHVSISTSGTTFSSCVIQVLDPFGNVVVAPNVCQSGNTFADVPNLSVLGTYTLLVDPGGAATGSVNVKLNDATDFTGPITPGGSSVTASTTVAGQNIRLTFTGTAGQRVSALFDNDTFPNGASVSILSPSGSTVITSSLTSRSSAFMSPTQYCANGSSQYPCGSITLPSNGTYTILVDPPGADIGSVRTTLYSVPADQTASATLGGTSVPLSLTVPGQNASITFSGTQNHKLGISITGGTFAGTVSAGCTLTVLQPSGFWTGSQNCYPSSSFLDLGVLPATGTYTVIVDPLGNTTGAANLQLYDDTDVTLAIAADGVSHTVNTTVPGQNASLTFSGTLNQRIFGVVNNISGYTGLTFSFASLRRLSTNQTLLNGAQDGAGWDICNSCEVEVLPATDTYSIFLNPNGTDVGSATVTLYTVPADFSATSDTAGTPVAVSTTTPGQNAQVTFTGTASQTLNLALSSGTYPTGRCLFNLQRPDGAYIAVNQDCSGASHTFGPYSLPLTGTYTIAINPQLSATGSFNLSATAH